MTPQLSKVMLGKHVPYYKFNNSVTYGINSLNYALKSSLHKLYAGHSHNMNSTIFNRDVGIHHAKIVGTRKSPWKYMYISRILEQLCYPMMSSIHCLQV